MTSEQLSEAIKRVDMADEFSWGESSWGLPVEIFLGQSSPADIGQQTAVANEFLFNNPAVMETAGYFQRSIGVQESAHGLVLIVGPAGHSLAENSNRAVFLKPILQA